MMLFHGVSLDCINDAATRYHVPATMIVSVIQIEQGHNGEAVKNKNGSYDLGVMQINSRFLNQLSKYGISHEDIKNNPCVNVQVGTWLLARGIANDEGWQGVGNYHSKTTHLNKQYRSKVMSIYFHNKDNLEREV